MPAVKSGFHVGHLLAGHRGRCNGPTKNPFPLIALGCRTSLLIVPSIGRAAPQEKAERAPMASRVMQVSYPDLWDARINLQSVTHCRPMRND